MPEIQVPIIRGEKTASSVDYIDRLPKNMLAVAKPVRGASGYLVSHDGLARFATGQGVDRGGFYNDRQGIHYRVSGGSLIAVNTDGATRNFGAISGSGQASLTYSFNNQLIVADGKAWLCNGTTLTQITDPDLGSPIDACWVDQYFFYTDGEFIYHSDILNESLINPLAYSTAAIMPDGTLGVLTTQDNLVMVLGRYSIEYFVNQANENFAFSRIAQKSLYGGIVGTHAKCMLGGQVFILGGARGESIALHAVGAGQLTKLSTRTVDNIINSYTGAELANAVLESRADDRDQVILVRLPRHTLCFNLGAANQVGVDNAWSILSYGTDEAAWLGANGVYDPRISKWVYGSTQGNAICTLSSETGAQDGQQTEYEFSTPIIPIGQSARIGDIELNTVAGYSAGDVVIAMAVCYDMAFDGMEFLTVYSGPLQYGRRLRFRRSVGYVCEEFGLVFRAVSASKINVSNLVINYV